MPTAQFISNVKDALKTKNKKFKILYRCSIKGRVNLAHYMAVKELKRLQNLGHECQILISDLGAYLDNEKCPWTAFQVIFFTIF